MDFSKISIEKTTKTPKATVVKFTPVDDKGAPLMLIGGMALELSLMPMTSPEGVRELQKWRVKFGQDDGSPKLEASEEELDDLVNVENIKGAELAARVVAGWNIKSKDGKDVPCTLENRKACFENDDFSAVAVAVMAQTTKIAEQLGNSKKT